MGILIVSEGPDGSGKETQTTLLCEHLQTCGFRVRRFDFPTYGQEPVADLIRALLHSSQKEWDALAWEYKALLFAANRARFCSELTTLHADPEVVIVCNRYVPSNQAHLAAYVDDEDVWVRRMQWIEDLEYEKLLLPRPNIVLLHTMPTETSQAFMEQRGDRDVHEANVLYQQRVGQCYRLLARRDPTVWTHIPADVDGRVQTPEEVHARVWAGLDARSVWRTFARQEARLKVTP